MNEDTIDAKSEWAVVSWTNFDIRFNANSPFEDLAKIGFVLRNSWDDEVTYHSQCLGWVNDQQVSLLDPILFNFYLPGYISTVKIVIIIFIFCIVKF